MTARLIALLGAESTGKTTLAMALVQALQRRTGQRCTWVSETLREWCDQHGRTPLQHEQAGIAEAQHQRIAEAALNHDWVVCDTTALQTAVYSCMVFNDRSLDARAVALHRHCEATLLTALDLPWQADGLQRDGPHVRAPVDAALRELLMEHGIAFHEVAGTGEARMAAAMKALAPLLG